MSFRFRAFASSLLASSLVLPQVALAGMSCDDIMNMLDYNVPSSVVVDTISSSGSVFTQTDISCLSQRGAPADVVAKAKSMLKADAAPAPSAPAPAAEDTPSSRFDQADVLGGDDEGGDEEDLSSGSGCAELDQYERDYKARKYQTAAEGLYAMLEGKTCPNKGAMVKYMLAKSLHEMEMFHSAQYYYMEVVREGPDKPLFRHALPRLAVIAEYTGNDYELLRVIAKIAPESYPRQARPHLHYLMGRKAYEANELSEAAANFDQVPAEHPLYPRAKYYEGVINAEREKFKSAVGAFKEVIRSQPDVADPRLAAEIEDLKDLSLINIGRIYFGRQSMDNADAHYVQVQRDSRYWPESLFERAWVNYWQRDLNEALGLLLTVDSPYFSENDFIPESAYLRSLVYFDFCEYDEVERMILRFKSKYQPIRKELRQVIERYSSDLKIADAAYDTYFGDKAGESKLPKALFARVLRNRDLAALVRHMDMMDGEVALIKEQKGSFQGGIGEHLVSVIEADRQRYKNRAGRALLSEFQRIYTTVDELLDQMDVVEFELADARRSDYMYKMSNPQVDATNDIPIDFATSTDIIYWPFNGEFWQDELSYYRYTEQGSCNN